MDARPTPEQRELQDAADRLAAKLGPHSVGDLGDADRRHRLDAAIAQAGWRELRTGTAAQSLASGVETAIVSRALARRCCDTAYIGPVLAHDLLRRAGHSGDEVARCIALSVDLSRVAMTKAATLADGGLAIDVAGATAAVLLVSTESREFIVAEAPLPVATTWVDLTRPVAALATDSAVNVISGAVALGADDLTAWTALAVTLSAVDLVGVMEGALELSCEYAKQRHQYGAPIGSYQAVQHLLAEAKTLTEGAASATIYAAWAVDALSPTEARAAAAVAKAYATRAARTVCETAIQVHGGIGNTWECMAHVYLRRALLSTELFGNDGPQLALLGQQRWGATNGLS